jgi:hypothetical protein
MILNSLENLPAASEPTEPTPMPISIGISAELLMLERQQIASLVSRIRSEARLVQSAASARKEILAAVAAIIEVVRPDERDAKRDTLAKGIRAALLEVDWAESRISQTLKKFGLTAPKAPSAASQRLDDLLPSVLAQFEAVLDSLAIVEPKERSTMARRIHLTLQGKAKAA